MSQIELADALGVTQSKISKYESGMLEVSDLDLSRLSRILEYPEDFFFQSDMVQGFGSACMHHRKRQSLPVKELRAIHATINALRIQAGRLLGSVEIGHNNAFHRLDIDEYDGSPEKIAQIVRANWGIPMGPIRNLVGVVEMAGGIAFPYPFGTDKIDAVSQWPRNGPPMFFVNKDIPTDRWRFSLAHELGHVVMHHVSTMNAESEADRFASEFLMPAREIADELNNFNLGTASRLKPYWRVSMQALIRRAFDLKKITERQYRSFNSQMSQLGYKKDEPCPIPPESPSVLNDLIEVFRKELGYSLPQLSKLALSDPHHFERLFLAKNAPRLRIVS